MRETEEGERENRLVTGMCLFSSFGGKSHRVDYAVVGWLNG